MIWLWLYLLIFTIYWIDIFVMLFRIERKENEENGRMDS